MTSKFQEALTLSSSNNYFFIEYGGNISTFQLVHFETYIVSVVQDLYGIYFPMSNQIKQTTYEGILVNVTAYYM